MSKVDLHRREIVLKLVYYGPGLGGKTTCLRHVHDTATGVCGKLVSLNTDDDRTLYFDYLPVELPSLGGYKIRLQLYTVPGQVHYNATRKLVLEGADGVLFVADSQADRQLANTESLANLKVNLAEHGCELERASLAAETRQTIPWVIQYNKRDLPGALPTAQMQAMLEVNDDVPQFESVATQGRGVAAALKEAIRRVLAEVRATATGEYQRITQDAQRITPAARSSTRRQGDAGRRTVASSLFELSSVVGHLASEPVPDQASPGTLALRRGTPESPPLHGTPAQLGQPPLATMAKGDGKTAEWHTAQAPATEETAPSLGLLVAGPDVAEQVRQLETALTRGNWSDVVLAAEAGVSALSVDIESIFPVAAAENPLLLLAGLTGMPGERIVRFGRAVQRATSRAEVTKADAVFAIFFFVDAALRAESIAGQATVADFGQQALRLADERQAETEPKGKVAWQTD